MKLSDENLAQTLWFLDYDGSLCPHQEVWEERQYDAAEILEAVRTLRAKSRAVFWNTGRRKDSLAGVNAAFLDFDGYFVMGSYRWDAAAKVYERLGPPLPKALGDFYQRRLSGSEERFRLEIKESALRIAPTQERYLTGLKTWLQENALADIEAAEVWEWVTGNRGIELLARGFDKGLAVRRELAAHPGAIPVAVGDDLLDRGAVAEVLTRGGYAFLVGDNCGWISQVPHQSWQIRFFERPSDVLEYFRNL